VALDSGKDEASAEARAERDRAVAYANEEASRFIKIERFLYDRFPATQITAADAVEDVLMRMLDRYAKEQAVQTVDLVFAEREDGHSLVFVQAEIDGQPVRLGEWWGETGGMRLLRIRAVPK
jgi:hypothetical protein